MSDFGWVEWARYLALADREEWRSRADRILARDLQPGEPLGAALERSLEAAWREIASRPSNALPAPQRAVYAVLDLETGGRTPAIHGICQVAVLTLDVSMHEVSRYQRI